MGIPVLIAGPSGSGKSTALEGFEPSEIGVFNVAGKLLPFRKKLPVINNARYPVIYQTLAKKEFKSYAIDDSQYLMAFDSFDRVKEVGYQKFTDMAVNFVNLIRTISLQLPEDVIVYFLHHTELTDAGTIKAKTLGKMIDNQITLEGLFSIVLFCMAEGPEHHFITNSDGSTTAKSPRGMFDFKIPNDLKMVDTAIREYYGFTQEVTNNE